MKSSAHKALASLQHKYRALIKQHGKLKNQLKDSYSVSNTSRVQFTEERRESGLFAEQLLKDNIAELELTIERLEFDLRAAHQRGTPGEAYREDVLRAERATRLAQNDAQQARSERDDAKQAVWVYGLLAFVVGVLGTYAVLNAFTGLVPGIY